MKTLCSIALSALLLAAVLITSCQKEADDSFNEPAYTGWAVGDIDQNYGAIFHTANDGMSWDRQGSFATMAYVNFLDVSALNIKDVWVVGDTSEGYGTVLHTSDGGINWARVGDTNVFGDTKINAVWAKSGKRVWVGGDSAKLVYTDNLGANWTPVDLDSLIAVRFTAISGDSTNIVWAVGNNTDTLGAETGPVVLFSTNGGTSFTNQPLMAGFTGHVYDISVVNDSTAWIAAGMYLFVTYDAGTNWQVAYTAASGDIHSVCAHKLGSVWAGGETGIMYRRLSTGQWNAFNPQGVRYTINGITLADTNRIWATGYKFDLAPRGTILYTHTTGRSWFIESYGSVNGMRKVSFANGMR